MTSYCYCAWCAICGAPVTMPDAWENHTHEEMIREYIEAAPLNRELAEEHMGAFNEILILEEAE